MTHIVRVTDPTRDTVVSLDLSTDRGKMALANMDFCTRAFALAPGQSITLVCVTREGDQ